MLMGIIPIKNVNVQTSKKIKVVPCGQPFGVKIFTNGVIVVGSADIETDQGLLNPAKQAGIKEGDVIVKVNDKVVDSNEDFENIIQNSGSNLLKIFLIRNGNNIETELTPAKYNIDNSFRIGLWVRDSSAGIGVMTFYNKATGVFAGLGHGICDIDTGEILSLKKGDILKVNINGIIKGSKGLPGELKGNFSDNLPIGYLFKNQETGVYGLIDNFNIEQEEISVAMKQDIKRGKAQILTTINGSSPEYYDIEISNVNYNEKFPTKNMIITITDKNLLEKTGGIVQGMSGSPIIQNGKLVGAITHVLVNDSKRGYAIFAETMISESECNIDNLKQNVS